MGVGGGGSGGADVSTARRERAGSGPAELEAENTTRVQRGGAAREQGGYASASVTEMRRSGIIIRKDIARRGPHVQCGRSSPRATDRRSAAGQALQRGSRGPPAHSSTKSMLRSSASATLGSAPSTPPALPEARAARHGSTTETAAPRKP